jgi:two-component system, OmpR family, sensor histidine kinase KdpD
VKHRAASAIDYAGAALLVALASGLCAVLRYVFSVPDLEGLYFVAVTLVAVRFGRGPSIFAAAVAVGAYNFLFVPPLYTFRVGDAGYLLTFAMMFVISILVSELSRRMRQQSMAAQAAQVTGSLLSAVSHDLRTPLGSITGAASSLRDDPALPPETRRELLESICEEAERMERLVSNLLEMTRIESGAVILKREWVPLEELVGSAFNRLEDKLERRPVKIDLPPQLPLLFVDTLLFEQVLVNLLENAAKYSPQSAEIELSARASVSGISIRVLDRGPGLGAGNEERVFEKFHRGSHVGIRGIGLGLSICRWIVEAHGGTIRAINRPSGGTAMHVELPRSSHQPEMDS